LEDVGGDEGHGECVAWPADLVCVGTARREAAGFVVVIPRLPQPATAITTIATAINRRRPVIDQS
jgi:hypothetical protein